MKFIIFFTCLFVYNSFVVAAQNKTIDSLGIELKKSKKDTTEVIHLNVLSRKYYSQGEYEIAMWCAENAKSLSSKLHFKKGIASAYKHIGNIYSDQTNLPTALNYYLKSLKLNEELGEKLEIAKCNNNISGIYKAQNQYKIAMDYLFKTMHTMKELGDSANLARCYNNLGDDYLYLHENKKAYTYFNLALKINEKLNDSYELSLSYFNIGQYYYALKNYNESLNYFFKSLNMRRTNNDIQGMVVCYAFISQTYFYDDKFDLSNIYSDSCLILSQQLGDLHYQSQSYALLSQTSAFLGKYENAYLYQRLYKKYSDSIFNFENSRQLSDLKTNFEVDKKTSEIKIKSQAEKEKIAIETKAKARTQRIITGSVITGLVLVIIFSVIIFKRLKVTRKQKQIIEIKERETNEQKHLIEEKHKEITDSINYAERIQRSFLATKLLLDENLNDYFVLFKPKDVVSGDFYWANKLRNGNFLLATADSTGHGVPGAIMSILNITSLEKAIEKNLEPSDILNTTRNTIIERLKKDGSVEGGKDGMDCSLISFDFKNKKLTVASANNPVWIVRANQVIEISADKMPVGKHDKQEISFKQEEINLQTGDMIYTLTDGFPDQFGGEKGKKFMSKKLRELIVANSILPMNKQKQILEEAFKDWVGKLEQVDDVTVIGIRV